MFEQEDLIYTDLQDICLVNIGIEDITGEDFEFDWIAVFHSTLQRDFIYYVYPDMTYERLDVGNEMTVVDGVNFSLKENTDSTNFIMYDLETASRILSCRDRGIFEKRFNSIYSVTDNNKFIVLFCLINAYKIGIDIGKYKQWINFEYKGKIEDDEGVRKIVDKLVDHLISL